MQFLGALQAHCLQVLPDIEHWQYLLMLWKFQWATALDLNMGYTLKGLILMFANMYCILPRGMYLNNRLHMCIVGSPDKFQVKMSDWMTMLEYISLYIDDLLVPTMDALNNYLTKLEVVISKLHQIDLWVSIVCTVTVECLGYLHFMKFLSPSWR